MKFLVPPASEGQTPVHVLIVVVGKYLHLEDLKGAAAFAGEVVDFWHDPSRIFPEGRALGSIAALVSDPELEKVELDAGKGAIDVDPPTYASCRDYLLEWCSLIRETGGVGVLHWIGHGKERAPDRGSIVSLLCDGTITTDREIQSGLDWSKALRTINNMTKDREVFCFLDSCRVIDDARDDYDGIGPASGYASADGALVFRSTLFDQKAFWLHEPSTAVQNAGCSGQALGMRAFLAALGGFGARMQGPATAHPISPAEIHEAASALAKRWARQQPVDQGGTEGPAAHRPEVAILLTDYPQSVVDFRGAAAPCQAKRTGSAAAIAAETTTTPFHFRLARAPHAFRFGSAGWSKDWSIERPYMDIY